MPRLLIVYGTTEGHTRKIAERVGNWVRERGIDVDVFDSEIPPPWLNVGAYDAYVLAGSLHETNHQRWLIDFAKEHAAVLKPSLFLSASLTAINKDEKHQKQAWECIDKFYSQTGWTATQALPVAGALLYTEYNFMKRTLMKMIVEKEGGPTDTSKDYEFTDWDELSATVESFLEANVAAHAA
jgi:menaquinone-dependent protoporphyrinogen oxidase